MDVLILSIVGAFVTICVFTDCRWQRIPNVINYPFMLAGLACQVYQYGSAGLLSGLAGILLGIGLFLIPFLLGGMGAGDVKMLGALGAFTGPSGVFEIFIYTALAGGLYTGCLLVCNRNFRSNFIARYILPLRVFMVTKTWITEQNQSAGNSPKLLYGIAIAAGAYLYVTEAYFGFSFLPPMFAA